MAAAVSCTRRAARQLCFMGRSAWWAGSRCRYGSARRMGAPISPCTLSRSAVCRLRQSITPSCLMWSLSGSSACCNCPTAWGRTVRALHLVAPWPAHHFYLLLSHCGHFCADAKCTAAASMCAVGLLCPSQPQARAATVSQLADTPLCCPFLNPKCSLRANPPPDGHFAAA